MNKKIPKKQKNFISCLPSHYSIWFSNSIHCIFIAGIAKSIQFLLATLPQFRSELISSSRVQHLARRGHHKWLIISDSAVWLVRATLLSISKKLSWQTIIKLAPQKKLLRSRPVIWFFCSGLFEISKRRLQRYYSLSLFLCLFVSLSLSYHILFFKASINYPTGFPRVCLS